MEISNKALLVLVLIAIIISLAGTWISLSKLQSFTGNVVIRTPGTAVAEPVNIPQTVPEPNCIECLKSCIS